MSNERQQRAARAEQMRKEREKADRRQRNVITIAIVVVVIALIAVAGFAITQTNNKNKTVEDVINPANAVRKDHSVVYSTEAVTGKPATDPVTVVAYEDFQCPACLNFEQQSGAFLADAVAKGDITMEYRPIAFLDESSNGNRYSTRAGSAALCVLDKDGVKGFKKMHDVLFANQPDEGANGRTDAELIGYAEQAGVTGIDSCIKSERFGPWLKEATDASRDADVSATPTVMVDGKVVDTPNVANLQKAIAAAKK